MIRHLRAALRWALRREYITKTPDFSAVFVRVDLKQPITIPEEDFLAMLKALQDPELVLQKRPRDWWRIFLYVAYYSGLRRSEILGLAWESVSFDTLEVHVSALTSKGRKDRVIPMAPELAQVLRDWQESQGGKKATGEVLPWRYDSYRQLYLDWHAIQKAAGIPDEKHYVPQNCRSSCTSELIAAGVPTVVVKDFLGHGTVTTTEKFYINTKPALRAAAGARKVVVSDSCRTRRERNEKGLVTFRHKSLSCRQYRRWDLPPPCGDRILSPKIGVFIEWDLRFGCVESLVRTKI